MNGGVMPRGPRGEKRPADVIGNAVKVMRIATGEEEEDLDRAKSAAAELGSRGGKARAARMTPERRAEIARKAAAKRWQR
jgi:general stress protein YciG